MSRATDDPRCTRSHGATGRCGQPLSHHLGDELMCPGSIGSRTPRTFRGHPVSATRASTSVNAREATVLRELCKRALAGGDVRDYAKINRAAVGRLQGVASSILARIAAQVAEREQQAAGEPEAVSGVHERPNPNPDATAWLEDGHGGELPVGYE